MNLLSSSKQNTARKKTTTNAMETCRCVILEEIWVEIFTLKELCDATSVLNRSMYKLMKEAYVWKRLIQRDFTLEQQQYVLDQCQHSPSENDCLGGLNYYKLYKTLFEHFVALPYVYPSSEDRLPVDEVVRIIFQSNQAPLGFQLCSILQSGSWVPIVSSDTVIGWDFRTIRLKPLPDSLRRPLSIQLWVPAGGERFRSIINSHYKTMRAFVAVVDVGHTGNNESQNSSSLSVALKAIEEAKVKGIRTNGTSLHIILVVISATGDQWLSTETTLSGVREHCKREGIHLFEFNEKNVRASARSMIRTLVNLQSQPSPPPPLSSSNSTKRCIIN